MSDDTDDTSSETNDEAEENNPGVDENLTEDSAQDDTQETETPVDQLDEMAAAMAEDAAGDPTEETAEPVDHMAEMAAAMAADAAGDTAEKTAEPVDHMAEMAAAMAEEPTAGVAENNFQSAEEIAKSVSSKDVNIATLLKVPVSLAIEVGRTQMSMNDLLETQEGSVIELERLLDEPLDILVNGALIAHGVVVLANERFGLQITDIISLEERARSL